MENSERNKLVGKINNSPWSGHLIYLLDFQVGGLSKHLAFVFGTLETRLGWRYTFMRH
jgi:hypothetical protein